MNINLNALDDMDSLLCTSAGGAVQGFSYTPFGSTSARSSNHSLLPGFNGERLDPVSQTYHLGNGYRTYNPVLMRFNAPDSWSPFGAGGLNPYAYCEGDPINRADPSGHMSWQAGVGIGLGILGILGAVFTFGQSLAAAAAAESALSLVTAADVIAAGLGVAASITSIASAATEESNPEASQILGWISFGLGIASAVTGVANAGKTIHAKFKKNSGGIDLTEGAYELRERGQSSSGISDDVEQTAGTSSRSRSARVNIWYPGECFAAGHAGIHIDESGRDINWMSDLDKQAVNEANVPITPDVTYDLFGLDGSSMDKAYRKIRINNTHYHLINLNCSTVVAKILKAGGADVNLGTFGKVFYTKNIYWTPKDVAQWCDRLSDIGLATKHRSPSCPSKWSMPCKVFLGFR